MFVQEAVRHTDFTKRDHFRRIGFLTGAGLAEVDAIQRAGDGVLALLPAAGRADIAADSRAVAAWFSLLADDALHEKTSLPAFVAAHEEAVGHPGDVIADDTVQRLVGHLLDIRFRHP